MSHIIENSFNFFLPAEVVKSGGKDDKRWIQGIASTEHLDLQGEKVLQSGIEYDYFLRYGYINDDHKSGPEHKVGEPTEAKITKDGFWIKGFLYKGKERADYWWEHLNSLEQSGSNRKVGFSIQGKVKRREGRKIAKCWIQDVAITASPVNVKTWAEIVKSLCNEPWCKSGPCCDSPDCDGECDHKALTTTSGAPLVPESLEGNAKVQTFKSLDEIPDHVSLDRDQWVRCLQLDKGWSRSTAKAVVDAIFISKGIK